MKISNNDVMGMEDHFEEIIKDFNCSTQIQKNQLMTGQGSENFLIPCDIQRQIRY